MGKLDRVDWNTGMITWVIGQDNVLLDDVASELLGLRHTCGGAITIDAILAVVVDGDRGRVARELYGCIADGGVFKQEFEVLVAGATQGVAVKGSAVGEAIFSCMIEPTSIQTRPGRLLHLCLAAYEAARQDNNDAAALHLIGAFSLIKPVAREQVTSLENAHVH